MNRHGKPYRTISIAELRRRLSYDPDTGRLTLRIPTPHRPAGMLASTTAKTDGYRRLKISGKVYREHRVIWAMMMGAWPDHEVDHVNRVRSDNRWCNLRKADLEEQARNHGLRKNNRSGHHGVCFFTAKKKWLATLRFSGKQHNLGLFTDKAEAAEAVRAAAKKHHGSFYDPANYP